MNSFSSYTKANLGTWYHITLRIHESIQNSTGWYADLGWNCQKDHVTEELQYYQNIDHKNTYQMSKGFKYANSVPSYRRFHYATSIHTGHTHEGHWMILDITFPCKTLIFLVANRSEYLIEQKKAYRIGWLWMRNEKRMPKIHVRKIKREPENILRCLLIKSRSSDKLIKAIPSKSRKT